MLCKQTLSIVLICAFCGIACPGDEHRQETSEDKESLRGTTWPQFRGVNGQNRAIGDIPLQFAPGTNELWKLPVAHGNSSPVIWGDALFLTGADDKHLFLFCVDRNTGQIKWQKQFDFDFTPDYFHTDSSPASPTCCTDGKRVYTYFGNYGVMAHDFEGSLIWEKRFSAIQLPFGLGASPIVYGDKLFVVRDVPSQGALYCYASATGREIWKAARPHARGGFSTPVVWDKSDDPILVLAGSGSLEGYRCDSGKMVWQVRNLPAIACTSPVIAGDRIVFGAWTTAHVAGSERAKTALDEDFELTQEEQENSKALIKRFDRNDDGMIQPNELPESRFKEAFRFLDQNRDGQLQSQELDDFRRAPIAPGRNVMVAVQPIANDNEWEPRVVWETTKRLPYVASPLVHDGHVYYVKKGGFLTKIDAVTGKRPVTKRLGVGGEYYATPLSVGSNLLVCAERGVVFVVDPVDMKVVHENLIGETIAATPAVVDDTLYLRTAEHLYAFRLPKQ